LINFDLSRISASITLQSYLLLLIVKTLIVLEVNLANAWLLNYSGVESHSVGSHTFKVELK